MSKTARTAMISFLIGIFIGSVTTYVVISYNGLVVPQSNDVVFQLK